MLPTFQINVFTEGESNVIIFNKEMHEDPCVYYFKKLCR